ncbi:MAG: hypothetical protein QOJ53_1867 [Sphingomonadales bacterium]|jgi:ferric-dicitrate binding protein FerR (iron transport regulator)|nr:hypothetical protein [Sphingomonadales bacterium]
MIVAGLLAFATAALPAQPASLRARTASLGVGANVVRPEPQPLVAVQSGAVTVRNAGSVAVSAEGGTARQLGDGTILVTPGAAGRMTITLTY